MIQTIGLMVAAYIFTRMVELASDKGRPGAARVLAVLTAGFTVICAVSLLFTSSPR